MVDIIILILFAIGAISGFKAGVIKKTTDFIGMFLILVLSFYLKNYLSVIMYENLPFFNLGGFIKGIDVINILIYEVLAFIIVFFILLLILKVLLMITGIIEKILKATIILSIPSKLLGIVVGIVEMYVYVFIILVVITLPVIKMPYVRESKIADFMLNNTPVLSQLSSQIVETCDDVFDIVDNREDKSNEQLNTDILKILLDKEVITKESAKKLVDANKLHINDYNIIE